MFTKKQSINYVTRKTNSQNMTYFRDNAVHRNYHGVDILTVDDQSLHDE